jgi:hypothetical protein
VKELLVKQGVVVEKVLGEVQGVKKEVEELRKEVEGVQGEVVEVRKGLKAVESFVNWAPFWFVAYHMAGAYQFWWVLVPMVEGIYHAVVR